MLEFCLKDAIDILKRTPVILESYLNDLGEPWIFNNEGENSWTPFDIVGHLIHGEKTDWIPRARMILDTGTEKPFPPFDRFAQFNECLGKKLHDLLKEFAELRSQNIVALQEMNLTERDFERKGIHPDFGEVTMKQLLSTWVVHDLGHIAQIARVMAKQYEYDCGPWQKYLTILKR